jgi:hypothetical protein
MSSDNKLKKGPDGKAEEDKDEVLCPLCEIPGHAEEDCDVPATIFTMSKNSKEDPCSICKRMGHKEDKCVQKIKSVIRHDQAVTRDA